MTTPPPNSLLPGEVGGNPKTSSRGASATEDKNPVVGRVRIRKIVEVQIHQDTADAVAGKVMAVCKAAFEKWKENHPHAEKTPIRFSMCSKGTPNVVQDHRPPAPKGQQP